MNSTLFILVLEYVNSETLQDGFIDKSPRQPIQDKNEKNGVLWSDKLNSTKDRQIWNFR